MTEKRPMVILTGPTAVGKTALSIELAKKINGSIISADSMQVYRHMDIGSAKVMPEEMNGVKHYLIDEFEPDEEFHVVKFVERAKEHLEEIYAEGKIPIIAGGTGFYIQALLYDIDFTEQECDEVPIMVFCFLMSWQSFPEKHWMHFVSLLKIRKCSL